MVSELSQSEFKLEHKVQLGLKELCSASKFFVGIIFRLMTERGPRGGLDESIHVYMTPYKF